MEDFAPFVPQAPEHGGTHHQTEVGVFYKERMQRGSGGGGTTLCPFGEIITFEGDEYIRGGVVYGGDSNWDVADYPINLAVDSDNLIWLEVGITANTEDSVLMPHLESCDEPTWESGSVAGGYPSNTAPNITTGVGTRIVPIGQLTVVDGVATLDPVGCGNITLGFCPPNNLSITRA